MKFYAEHPVFTVRLLFSTFLAALHCSLPPMAAWQLAKMYTVNSVDITAFSYVYRHIKFAKLIPSKLVNNHEKYCNNITNIRNYIFVVFTVVP